MYTWLRFRRGCLGSLAVLFLAAGPALAFDVSGLIGGVMQGAIQAQQQQQQQQMLERQQQFQRQQQMQYEVQRMQAEAEQRRAAALWTPQNPGPPTGAPQPPAVPVPPPIRGVPAMVDGHSLGQILVPETLPSDFRCHPSEQFSASQWCRSRKPVNKVWTSTSVILTGTNAIAYYSKFYESTVFQPQGVAGEIDRLSALQHEQARVLRMPGAARDEGAVIATWGALTLTSLDAATVNSLAGGESVTAGVLVDFLNNARESAKRGLPVYRLTGGPGYYWVAHYGRGGEGNLRFGLSDAQSFDIPKPPPQPAAPVIPPPVSTPTVVAVASTPTPPAAAAGNHQLSDAVALPPSGIVNVSSSPNVVPTPAAPAPATAVEPPSTVLPDIPTQGRRAALVIGNSNYEAVPHLENPKRDAEAVAEALKAAGFDSVTLVTDATLPTMKRALRDLQDEADKVDWAMVYYAGHGIQLGGENYLIPIDAHLVSDRDAEDEAVSLTHVLDRLQGAKKLRLVVLDACREDPFDASVRRHGGTRDVTRGLARFDPAVANEMVVYAAKEHQLAQDGTADGHSPFAKALLARLGTPKLEINKLFRMVTNDVEIATNDHQQPFVYGSTPGLDDFYFRTQ